MSSYKIEKQGDVLKIGFGEPAQNDKIVRDANELLKAMKADGTLSGGEVIKVNGPASLPVAMLISHELGHIFSTIACFDPKLSKYVVSVTHGGKYELGDLID